MSEKVELFHFDNIASEYHGESLYCGLCSSLSLQVDKDCTITVYGQINPRSGEYFQLQVLNEKTMKTSANITEAGNYFVHISGCYRVKFEVDDTTGVSVGGVFGKYHYPSAEVNLDDFASIEYVDSKIGAATEEEFREMLHEVLGVSRIPTVSEIIHVIDVSLNRNNLSMAIGDTTTLIASVYPSNAKDRDVTWSITPENIATITDGNIEAIATGVGTITATAGGKTAICHLVVQESDTDDVPGHIPFYKLEEPKTFVAANEDCIDTQVKLFDILSPKPNWTLLLEGQTGDTVQENAPDTYCLVHCMDETGHYPGLSVAVWADSYGVGLYGSSETSVKLADSKANKFKIAIQIASDGKWNMKTAIGTNVTSKTWEDIYDYGPAIDKTLLLGCYQQSDGTKGRFWEGTLYQALLYDSVLTNTEINTWLSKQ